ncbi:hypothetical protein, partial [Vibrio neptunius]|uniref:hypothetical protein n=1 Tax=Vibrio neptunius TaxID=170651 RepID=UPI0019D2DFF9
RPVTPGVAGSSPVRSATYLEKALTAMLGFFRICGIIFESVTNESRKRFACCPQPQPSATYFRPQQQCWGLFVSEGLFWSTTNALVRVRVQLSASSAASPFTPDLSRNTGVLILIALWLTNTDQINQSNLKLIESLGIESSDCLLCMQGP